MSTHTTRTGSVLARTGLSVAVAATLVGALATASHATTTQQALTLSSTTGPKTGTNTITLSLPTSATSKFVSGQVGVQFQLQTTAAFATASCATAPTAAAVNVNGGGTAGTLTTVTVGTDKLRFISSTKVSVVVPDLTGVDIATGAAYSGTLGVGGWMVCAYNSPANGVQTAVTTLTSSTATVLGKGSYISAAQSGTLTISPAKGPAGGGQTVTITGTNFPTTVTANTPLTATIGGVALTNIVPVSATQFTGVTGPHASNAVAQSVAVTTAGGTTTTPSLFTFVDGITVSPNTVQGAVVGTGTVTSSTTDVDVQGVNFNALTWTAANTDGATANTNTNSAHVYLTRGAYDATSFVAGGGGTPKTNGQVAECTNVAVISDTELICTVDPSWTYTVAAGVYTKDAATGTAHDTSLKDGAYTVVVVSSGSLATGYTTTALSSGATLTVAPY